MSFTSKKIILSGILLLTYGLIFFFLITSQLRLDFTSFYSSTLAYQQGTNPYQALMTTYFSIPLKLSTNLNPPIFMQLISPIIYLSYQQASSLWFFISLALGSIGALLSFKLTCSSAFFKKNWFILLFIYLAMYPTMISLCIGQLGGILLFFIMLGYYCYNQKQDALAGLFWGIIIAVKFFPGLILLFVLNQKRYKVFFITLLTTVLASLLPLLFIDDSIYSIYFNMLPRIMWFGDNWNGSIYGFLFRLFVNEKLFQTVLVVKITYLILFAISLIWYIKKINLFSKTAKNQNNPDHRAFSLTLVMMLLMSPMGWVYYFSLLIMPLTIIWQSLTQGGAKTNKNIILWALSLFLINFPIGYVEMLPVNSVLYKLGFYSFYFYGLIVIAYLVSEIKYSLHPLSISEQENNPSLAQPLTLFLTLGLFVTLACFMIQMVLK